MATVQLTDIYNPVVFNQAVQEAAVELNAFLASGVAVQDAQVSALASGPGNIGDLPFYLGLGNPQADGTNEPNYSSDNPASPSTPAKIGSAKMIWRKAMMNASWSTMDLSRELALQDPLAAITNRIGQYWAVNNQTRLIQSAIGVLADNVANDSGDMLHTAYSDVVSGSITAAMKISPDNVIAAKETMGDHATKLTTIAMHSIIYSELQRQEVIIYEKAAGTNILFPTYLGYRVVVDDSMPVTTGTNSPSYTSVLFGSGAFAQGSGSPAVPSELEREASQGDGGGQDIIHSRMTEIIHPIGFEFLSSAIAANSPSLAELAEAAQWSRVYANRKNVPMAFLQTNG